MTDWLQAEKDPRGSWMANTKTTDTLVRACAERGIAFIYISCCDVFGAGGTTVGYNEEDTVGPLHVCGCSKVSGENAVLRIGQSGDQRYWNKGFKYWILRTGYLYERPWRVSNNLAYLALRFSESSRSGDGFSSAEDKIASYCYVPHLADHIKWLLFNRFEVPSGIYHVADRGHISEVQFLRQFSMYLRRPVNVEPVPTSKVVRYSGMPSNRISLDTRLDCAKFARDTAVKLPSWKEGVEQYARLYKKL